MTYNLTQIGAQTNTTAGFVLGVNEVLLGGWLGTLFLITFAIIMFMYFINATNNTSKSLSASLFITLGLSFLLRALTLIKDEVLIGVVVLTAAVIAITWKSNN